MRAHGILDGIPLQIVLKRSEIVAAARAGVGHQLFEIDCA